jgi:hypothetical protein
LSRLYYEIAAVTFQRTGPAGGPRKYARQALEIKPNYCEALMLIGDIYVAASRNFGENEIEKGSVFWVAVDYYERARSQPDCAVWMLQKNKRLPEILPKQGRSFFPGFAGRSDLQSRRMD